MSKIRLSITLAVISSLLLSGFSVFFQPKVNALSGSSFKAGRIIDDPLFFAKSSMNATQIQAFLNSKVPNCSSGYTCLKDHKQATSARSAESGLCGSLSARSNRSAANIINDVSKACGISPKVMIVLLQKEQSLVTDTSPSDYQYKFATGFCVYDSGSPPPSCANTDGFYDQVYFAARQFKKYARDADNYNYKKGFTSFVQYNPNTGCGGKNITMQNQATANLYNYTPYTPNQAALNNLYGEGNSCSAYGNRNFWRLYNDWFGNTLTNLPKEKNLVGDWDNNGRDEIGLRKGNINYLDTDNDGTVDIQFAFGRESDQAFVGDWDGDGRDDLGLKRGNMYYLDIGRDGSADITFSFGRSSDSLRVGDWDGDGIDEMGLKRGNIYYLDTGLDGGSADIAFPYGKSSDQAFVGDWDGDDKHEIGLRRGNIYYLNSENDSSANNTFSYGRSSDKVFSGDWNKDGEDKIGVRRGNIYYLENNNSGATYTSFSFGKSSDASFIGDWDGDDKHEIGLRRWYTYFLDYHLNSSANATIYFDP